MNEMLHIRGSAFTVVEFKLNAAERYCLWYFDEDDNETFYQTDQRIAVFMSLENVRCFCMDCKISYEMISFDLDAMIHFMEEDVFDRAKLLDFINIVSDIAKTCDIEFDEEKGFSSIYDKLFYGQNLSMINTSGRKYVPVFDPAEKAVLKRQILQGVEIVDIGIMQKV